MHRSLPIPGQAFSYKNDSAANLLVMTDMISAGGLEILERIREILVSLAAIVWQ
jgi:hypothetical protein